MAQFEPELLALTNRNHWHKSNRISQVQAIFANGTAVDFFYALKGQEQVKIYPVEIPLQLPEGYLLRSEIGGTGKFILDVHLGKLARTLRMLGFDCYYENEQSDQEIAARAEREDRIVLSRDVGLLKHKVIQQGHWLRSQNPEEQLREVIHYYKLVDKFRPFTRCLACNGNIVETEKAKVVHRLPPKTRQYYKDFFQCLSCEKVYWKGSHYEQMKASLNALRKKETASNILNPSDKVPDL